MHHVLAYNDVAAGQDAIDWELDLEVWIQSRRWRFHFRQQCCVSGLPLAFGVEVESGAG